MLKHWIFTGKCYIADLLTVVEVVAEVELLWKFQEKLLIFLLELVVKYLVQRV